MGDALSTALKMCSESKVDMVANAVFDQYDNGDGQMSASEVSSALGMVQQFTHVSIPPEAIQSAIDAVDHDNDGQLDRAEFEQMVDKLCAAAGIRDDDLDEDYEQ